MAQEDLFFAPEQDEMRLIHMLPVGNIPQDFVPTNYGLGRRSLQIVNVGSRENISARTPHCSALHCRERVIDDLESASN